MIKKLLYCIFVFAVCVGISYATVWEHESSLDTCMEKLSKDYSDKKKRRICEVKQSRSLIKVPKGQVKADICTDKLSAGPSDTCSTVDSTVTISYSHTPKSLEFSLDDLVLTPESLREYFDGKYANHREYKINQNDQSLMIKKRGSNGLYQFVCSIPHSSKQRHCSRSSSNTTTKYVLSVLGLELEEETTARRCTNWNHVWGVKVCQNWLNLDTYTNKHYVWE